MAEDYACLFAHPVQNATPQPGSGITQPVGPFFFPPCNSCASKKIACRKLAAASAEHVVIHGNRSNSHNQSRGLLNPKLRNVVLGPPRSKEALGNGMRERMASCHVRIGRSLTGARLLYDAVICNLVVACALTILGKDDIFFLGENTDNASFHTALPPTSNPPLSNPARTPASFESC